MSARYLFSAGEWHSADGTLFLWLTTRCDGQEGAGFYAVLLGDYPKGEPLRNALRSVAALRHYDDGAKGELCEKCFGVEKGGPTGG